MKVYRSKAAKEKILSTYDVLIEDWGIPVDSVEVPTRYGVTYVNIFGEKEAPPLVLFHGVGDDSALMWIYNAAELAKYFHIYAIDTIGGPGKSRPNHNYNKHFDDILWLDEVFDYFQLNNLNIAGVSNGGYLAQYYTLARNNRVNKVLCMASSVPVSSGGSTIKTMMKIFFPEAFIPTQKNVNKLLKKLAGKNSAAFTENTSLLEHFTYLMRGFNNMAMAYHKVIPFTDHQVESIREKCRYFVGEEDPFAKLGGKAMLEKYEMDVEYFEGVGHGINHEIPEEINSKLIAYFTE